MTNSNSVPIFLLYLNEEESLLVIDLLIELSLKYRHVFLALNAKDYKLSCVIFDELLKKYLPTLYQRILLFSPNCCHYYWPKNTCRHGNLVGYIRGFLKEMVWRILCLTISLPNSVTDCRLFHFRGFVIFSFWIFSWNNILCRK